MAVRAVGRQAGTTTRTAVRTAAGRRPPIPARHTPAARHPPPAKSLDAASLATSAMTGPQAGHRYPVQQPGAADWPIVPRCHVAGGRPTVLVPQTTKRQTAE